ncbi:extracellular solute-binding protein [Paenibacillus sp. S150]|nr:extracellular solute-binding protein [Paenibacillus sp. S150]
MILSLVLSACSGANNASNPNSEDSGDGAVISAVGKLPIADQTITLKMFAPQKPTIENMETNTYTKWLEEQTNIHIDWDLAAEDALNERKQLMLASGDYPEVILHGNLTKDEQMRYGSQGVLLPLNGLIDQYAPNVKAAMADIDYLSSSMTAPDGNIYSIPMVNECFHCTYPQKYWINQAWLDKLGLEVPTTTDELYTVLKAFKEQDPNGNGKADEIPLTGTVKSDIDKGNFDGYLMNAFIYNDSDTYLTVDNGTVDFAANKEEWKQGLQFMNKLYSEGLIDQGAFTQNEDAVNQLANREPDNIMGSITTMLISFALSPDDAHPRHKDYVAVPPLIGPSGVQQAGIVNGIANGQFALTNKATEQQQIAAIRLVDFLFTEESVLLQEKGPEGERWRLAETGELDFNGEQAKYTDVPFTYTQTHNIAWEQIGPSLRTKEYLASFTAPQDPLAEGGYGTRLYKETQEKYEPYATESAYPQGIFLASEDSDEAAQLKTTISDYVNANMAQFITGSKDIEKEWDAYVSGFEGLQLSRYLEIYQNALNR